MKNRKAVLYIVSVIAMLVAAKMGLDISTNIVALYGVYCVGNVGAKFSHKNDQ